MGRRLCRLRDPRASHAQYASRLAVARSHPSTAPVFHVHRWRRNDIRGPSWRPRPDGHRP